MVWERKNRNCNQDGCQTERMSHNFQGNRSKGSDKHGKDAIRFYNTAGILGNSITEMKGSSVHICTMQIV